MSQLITLYIQTLNTLLIDQNPTLPATAQAASNIVRCTFAAIGSAVEQLLLALLVLVGSLSFLLRSVLHVCRYFLSRSEGGWHGGGREWKLIMQYYDDGGLVCGRR